MRVMLENPWRASTSVVGIDVLSSEWKLVEAWIQNDSVELAIVGPESGEISISLRSADQHVDHKIALSSPTASIEFDSEPLYFSPIWPNPASQYISLNVRGLRGRTVTAFLYDLLGKEVTQQSISDDGIARVELPSLIEGRYYFMVRDGQETLCMQEIQIAN